MKDWTIMIYMAGDNNLSEDMITGLKGMRGMMGNKKINLIALYDSNYPPVPVKIYEFSKRVPKRGKPQEFDLSDFESDMSPNPNRPSPQLESYWIKSFVPRVIKKFPARKYALILSGHSDGIIGRNLLRDENPNISLTVQKLKGILMQSLPTQDGGRKKKRFDLLGFDGCLMSMIEVGYELKDVASVIVASEGNIPTAGWNYENILEKLKAEPKSNAKELAQCIVGEYATYNVDYSISGRSIDIGACDLTQVEPLADAIHAFAGYLLKLLDLVAPKDERNPAKLEDKIVREHFIDCLLLAHYRSQTFMHNQGVDLVDFASNLIRQSLKRLFEHEFGGKSQQSSLTNRILDATKDLFGHLLKVKTLLYGEKNPYIIASCTTGAEYQFSKGTAIFFPWTRLALEMIHGKYKRFGFNYDKRWLKLIKKRLDLTLRTQSDEKSSPKDSKATKGLKLNNWMIADSNITKSFAIDVSKYFDIAHREHGGKEHGGKEHGGKGQLDAFYKYFSEFQNYDPEFLDGSCNRLTK